MLSAPNGNVNRVLTGITVIDTKSGSSETEVVETLVKMSDLTDEEIKAHVATVEPWGKAGGYAVQSVGAIIVESISGCFYNVVGLPLYRLRMMLDKHDIRFI